MVLGGWLSNSPPPLLQRAIRAYRELDLTGVSAGQVRSVPKRARWLNESERARLAARYEAGALVRELAVEFGINRTTVAKQLKAAGVTLRCGPFTAVEIARSIELYATGLSTVAVAREIGRDKSAVWRTLGDAGVVMRDTQGRERGS